MKEQMGTGSTSPEEKDVDIHTDAGVGAREKGVPRPDPEVVVRPQRRTFTAEYKEQILAAVDACRHGEIGTFLRHEGLTSSMVSRWRKARDLAIQRALETKKPGPAAKEPDPRDERIAELERKLKRTEGELSKAKAIIDVQKKSRSCWHRACRTRTASRPDASCQATRTDRGLIRCM